MRRRPGPAGIRSPTYGPARSAEFLALGPAVRNDAAGLGARALPVLRLVGAEIAAIGVTQPVLPHEHCCISQTAILVALQANALPARELRHLGQRENQKFAVLPNDGDTVAGDKPCNRRFRAGLDV